LIIFSNPKVTDVLSLIAPDFPIGGNENPTAASITNNRNLFSGGFPERKLAIIRIIRLECQRHSFLSSLTQG
jgi:hypothetical protein